MLSTVKIQNQEVLISREALLRVLEKLLEKDPSDFETAVLFVAVRDGISVEEALEEIEKESAYIENDKVLMERLRKAEKSPEEISFEDVKKRFGL